MKAGHCGSILLEEDVVVEVGELRGKLTQLGAPCCLYYFLLCHYIE